MLLRLEWILSLSFFFAVFCPALHNTPLCFYSLAAVTIDYFSSPAALVVF